MIVVRFDSYIMVGSTVYLTAISIKVVSINKLSQSNVQYCQYIILNFDIFVGCLVHVPFFLLAIYALTCQTYPPPPSFYVKTASF